MTSTLITATVLTLFSVVPLARAGNIASESSQTIPTSWKISLAPVLATQTLDVASSYGMRELNPVLAGSNGRFGAKAATMKLGATAALLGIEYLIVKAHPGAARVFTKINWSASILTGGLAVHNFAVR